MAKLPCNFAQLSPCTPVSSGGSPFAFEYYFEMATPEDKARKNIDRLLTQAGWAVRDQSDVNLLA